MNEHRRIQDLLGPYLLDSLEPEEALEVREHLSRCRECRAEELGLRRAHEQISDFAGAAETPPPELKERVLAELPRRGTRWTSLLVAAATICVLLALGILFASSLSTRGTEVALQPTEFAPRAGGELRIQRDDSNVEATLEVWNLPRQESDEYYELWFGRGEAVSVRAPSR